MRISISDTVSAFDTQTIGSKITDTSSFLRVLIDAISGHDFNSDRVKGQAYLVVPDAIPFVSYGQGQHRRDPDAYVLREHRGRVHAYLKRENASPVVEVSVVVYTQEAYLNDPDIDESGPQERKRILRENPDYVLVAVLASSTPSSTLSPYRFVKNLAGGNHEALVWSADEIREKAREISIQVDKWATVSD
jgi:hypothetical protein